jgi:MFS family permease
LGWRLRGGLSILARSGNHHLGLLTFVVLVIAMLVQPISGALSDRWVSRWGKRRPLILFGTIFDFVFLAILGWVGGLSWLALGYIGLQLSSNLARGPLQGLMPDKVPPEQLGIGSGIKNLIDMLGLVLSSLFWGRLLDAAAGRGSHRYPDRVREKPVLRHRKSVASPEQIPKPTSTIPAQSSLPIAASRPTPG